MNNFQKKSKIVTIIMALIGVILVCIWTSASFAVTQTPTPSANKLSGLWEGYYYYKNNQSPPVNFSVNLTFEKNLFSGKTKEPNTFGNKNEPFLYADIYGKISEDNKVTFTKTYDGTGGVSHSVLYEGTLDRKTVSITGTWSLPNNVSGKFDMKLIK